MVKSIINADISYIENTEIDDGDIGLDALQFEVELFPGLDVTIALGNVQYTYADKGILFIPVYLINKMLDLEQIGLYEFPASQYTEYLDEDDDFDITLLENPIPLFYSFFDENYLRKALGKRTLKIVMKDSISSVEDKSDKEEDKENDDKNDEEESEIKLDEWTSPNDTKIIDEILGEDENEFDMKKNMQDAITERSEYIEQKNDVWIKKYMKSSRYALLDNEGKGDCLFAVIRDAYKGLKEMTVEDLRKIVSDNATQDVYDNFKQQYEMFADEIKKTREKQIELKDTFDDKLSIFKTEQDRNEKKKFASQLKGIKTEFDTVKREFNYAQDNIKDFLWMKGINTLDEFKDIIKSCDFWAEQWSIHVLERILNIKLIILSHENYEVGDDDNVLSCGDFVDKTIEDAGEFKPIHYIIVSYTGNHYMLVTYKSMRIFNFKSLPYAIKEIILNKCMETDSGIYNMIPQFKKLKKIARGELDSDESEEENDTDEEENDTDEDDEVLEINIDSVPKTDEGMEDIDEPEEEKYDDGFDNYKDVSFNDNIVFQFYSKSRDLKPGKGAGEKIPDEEVMKFAELDNIKDWRKILSNFYESVFELDGMRWLSVENYYHASKFKKNNPSFYKLFSLNSKSDISKDPRMAKAAGGKTGKYKGVQIRPKKIMMDDDFFTSKENEKAMYTAQLAKYRQNELAKKTLLATKDAKLQHFVRGNQPIVFYDIMKIRKILSK
jgi:predicted NAD-dependent protein-ADP-ribosyltransferase YbiA (DUF1768 family)